MDSGAHKCLYFRLVRIHTLWVYVYYLFLTLTALQRYFCIKKVILTLFSGPCPVHKNTDIDLPGHKQLMGLNPHS